MIWDQPHIRTLYHAYSDMMYACCVSKCIELHSNLHGHPGTRVLNTANQLQDRIQVLEAKAWPSQVRSRLKLSRSSTASLAARARLTNQLVVLDSGQALELIQSGIDRLFITFFGNGGHQVSTYLEHQTMWCADQALTERAYLMLQGLLAGHI